MTKPYYMIKFSGFACMFEIRVNDIPVITLNLDGQAATNIPINYAIFKSGLQEITVKVLPNSGNSIFNEGAEFKYDILLYDVSNGFEFKEEFSGYKTPKVNKNKMIPAFINKIPFQATVPFSLKTLWLNGEDISEINDLQAKLRRAYYKIGNLIITKNYDAFKKEIANREFNMANSMYLEPVDSRARLNGLIKDFESGFDEMVLNKEALVVISANNKKVSLKTFYGEPALKFLNRKTKEEIQLDIEFYFNKETNTFEII